MITAAKAKDANSGTYFRNMAYTVLDIYEEQYGCGFVPSSYLQGKGIRFTPSPMLI